MTFANLPDASPGSDVGYVPYVDLILPTKGADGSGPGVTPVEVKDGVTFQSASIQGQTLEAISIEFDQAGNAIHPFARDSAGQLRVVHANDYGAQPGDTLVTLRLPFGSYTPSQPAAAIQVNVGIAPLADLGTPLAFTGVLGAANYDALRGGPTTNVNFRVGDEMVARGLDGVLDGGGGPTAARTEVVIVFRSVVDANYANGDPVVDDDAVANTITGSANVQPSGNAIGDNSSDGIPITPGQIDGKTVYAINGNTTVPADPL